MLSKTEKIVMRQGQEIHDLKRRLDIVEKYINGKVQEEEIERRARELAKEYHLNSLKDNNSNK